MGHARATPLICTFSNNLLKADKFIIIAFSNLRFLLKADFTPFPSMFTPFPSMFLPLRGKGLTKNYSSKLIE